MPDAWRRLLAESIATMLLVLFGVGAAATDQSGGVATALAFGAVVAAMVYAVGHVSGAHLNPAVTVALAAIGRFPRAEVPAYVAAQLFGATLGAAALHALVGVDASVGVTLPLLALPGAFFVEAITTFCLVFVIVAVATDEGVPAGVSGVAIGLAVLVGAIVGGPLTGGSMNPARSFGPAAVAGLWSAHALYWTAPVVGGVLGAACYQAVRGRDGVAPVDATATPMPKRAGT